MRNIAALLLAASIIAGCSSNLEPEESAGVSADEVKSNGCTPGGLYCGGDKVAGKKDVLYRCDSQKAVKVEACASTCVVSSGQNDACKATHSLAEATSLVKTFYAAPKHRPVPTATTLTPELLDRVTHPAFVPASAADFTCAQDDLAKVNVAPAVRDGETARVAVNGGDITVIVRLSDLRIAGWTCGKGNLSGAAVSAHQIVREFYGESGPANWRKSPLIEKPLRAALEAYSDPAKGGTNVDPVLCAQDQPDKGISVDPPILMGDLAVMTVRENFTGSPVNRVVTAVDLHTLKFGTFMCAPFKDGGAWDAIP